MQHATKFCLSHNRILMFDSAGIKILNMSGIYLNHFWFLNQIFFSVAIWEKKIPDLEFTSHSFKSLHNLVWLHWNGMTSRERQIYTTCSTLGIILPVLITNCHPKLSLKLNDLNILLIFITNISNLSVLIMKILLQISILHFDTFLPRTNFLSIFKPHTVQTPNFMHITCSNCRK